MQHGELLQTTAACAWAGAGGGVCGLISSARAPRLPLRMQCIPFREGRRCEFRLLPAVPWLDGPLPYGWTGDTRAPITCRRLLSPTPPGGGSRVRRGQGSEGGAYAVSCKAAPCAPRGPRAVRWGAATVAVYGRRAAPRPSEGSRPEGVRSAPEVDPGSTRGRSGGREDPLRAPGFADRELQIGETIPPRFERDFGQMHMMNKWAFALNPGSGV
eukprot:gene10886-biopygen1796